MKDLLQRMLDFYKKKYSDDELADKFNRACVDLLNSNDLQYKAYQEFCKNNNIVPYAWRPSTKVASDKKIKSDIDKIIAKSGVSGPKVPGPKKKKRISSFDNYKSITRGFDGFNS